MYKRILSLKSLFLEIILLYICIAIVYRIPYSFNIFPINSVTENDLFRVLTPFIVLCVLWLIVILIISSHHKED